MKKMHRALPITMSILVSITSIFSSQFTLVQASGENISIETSGSEITFGNDLITREFDTAGKKLSTSQINNYRADDVVFTPAKGSEEFYIHMIETEAAENGMTPIDRAGWSVTTNNYHVAEAGQTEGPAEFAIDGNLGTWWHTDYDDTKQSFPLYLDFDLGKATDFQSFSYTPRQNGDGFPNANGCIDGYKLYASDTKEGLNDEANIVAEGNFKYGKDFQPIYVNTKEPVKAQYVRFAAVSSVNKRVFAAVSEFNLYEDKAEVSDAKDDNVIKTSDLTYKSYDVENTSMTTRKDVNKKGKKLTFHFEPYKYEDVTYSIDQVVVMYEGDPYMRKYIEISASDLDRAKIDYIDGEHLVVNDSDETWTVPLDQGGIPLGDMTTMESVTGQPIYVQGMYLGSEFPVVQTHIEDDTNLGRIRYYSGKSFSQMKEENLLTEDDKFVSWQTVLGASRSTNYNIVQADFFDYIDDISSPSEFRVQYNSWYDNMMYITPDNVEEASIAAEKGLTQNGVKPISTYVIDDGWNNYNTYAGQFDPTRTGTTANKTGFWEFNSKFPDGFTPISDLAHRLGSDFGVWLGPRGGYWEGTSNFGRIVEAAGTGHISSTWNDVDVASNKYIKNLETFWIDQQTKNRINYWKLDGFSQNPCTNKAHDHMVGGQDDMYYYTDMWEGYVEVFDKMIANAKEQKIDNYWLSLTCFVFPSPWFLQWGNSIWLQDSYDLGRIFTNGKKDNNDLNAIITFRDDVYYELLVEKQLQFPIEDFYNHDPVYGKEGSKLSVDTDAMNNEEFETYLYMMAARGNKFWELYYSPTMMDQGDKWKINADFLAWAEENAHILENAKLFGNDPAKRGSMEGEYANHWGTGDTYGFSCWDGTEGIISIRNAGSSEKEFTFTLNEETMGVKPGAVDLFKTELINHGAKGVGTDIKTVSYGDTITLTLPAYANLLWEFSPKEDTTAPTVKEAYSINERVVTLTFNERIKSGDFSVEGNSVIGSKILGDHRTVEITLTRPCKDTTTLNVVSNNVVDYNGNTSGKLTSAARYYKDNIIASSAENDLSGSKVIEKMEAVNGNRQFTVNATVNTNSTGKSLVSQKGTYALEIDAKGHAVFNVNGLTVTSNAVVTGKETSIGAVYEKNGMAKIYINGELDASAYDEKIMPKATEKADTIIGESGFNGTINNVQVINYALGYDEYKETEPEVKLNNVALNKKPEISWVNPEETAKVKEYQMIENLTDGAITLNAADFADYGPEGINTPIPSYVEIDLEKESKVSQINLFRYWAGGNRINNATAIVLSKTKDFKDANVVYNSDKDGTVYGLGKGTDELYTEVEAGKKISLDTPVNARYVRLYVNGGKVGNNVTSSNHLVELQVFEKAETLDLDYDAIGTEIETAEAIDSDNFTANSMMSLNNAIKAAKEVCLNAKDQSELDRAEAQVRAAREALVSIIELKSVIKEAEAIDSNNFTSESYGQLMAVVEASKALMDAGTAAEIETAVTNIRSAISNLVAVDGRTSKQVLGAAIHKAQELINQGVLVNVNGKVMAAFEEALDNAVRVYANAEATDQELMAAWHQLATSMHYLDFTADTSKLRTLLEEYEQLDLSIYVNDNHMAEFIASKEYAQQVLDNENSLDNSITKAFDRLTTAKSNLVLASDQLDTTVIDFILNKGAAAIDKEAYYNTDAESWTVFKAAYDAAVQARADMTSQEAINQAASALADAYLEIRLIANEDVLKELADFIAVIDNVNANDYSTETMAFFMKTRAVLQQMVESGNFTMTEYNNAKANIKEVETRIVKDKLTTNEPSEPKEPVTPEETDQTANAPVQSMKPAVSGTTKPATGDVAQTGMLMMSLLGAGIAVTVSARRRRNQK